MEVIAARSNLMYVCIIIISLISLVLTGQSVAKIDPKSIVGVWLLDEGTGEVAKDSSGNGYHGELMKEAEWVEGKFGKAIEFDGVDDRVDCGDIDALDFGTGDFTLCVWVNSASTGAGEAGNGWSRILDKHYITGFCLMRSSGGARVQFEVGGNAVTTISSNAVFDDSWHHIAAVRYDNNKSRIYIDGNLDIESNLVGGDMANDYHFCMAYDNLGLGGNMKCRLDEVAIFNVALTGDDIKEIVTEGLATMLAVQPAGKLITAWGTLKAR